MALPSSGTLSMDDIRTELGLAQSNVSLRSMSNTAGFSTPDAISEFYGYSAASGIAILISYYNGGSGEEACALSADTDVYKNGTTGVPLTGESLFSDSSLTTAYLPANGDGWYRIYDNAGGYYYVFLVGNYIEAAGKCR